MRQITIKTTHPKQVVDVRHQIESLLEESDIQSGLVHIFSEHTTCGLVTANLDPGTDQDYLDAIEAMFPDGDYRHLHNPQHVGDHVMSSIIGSEVTLPFKENKLLLGTWQELVLIELNGPRQRTLTVNIWSGE